MLCTLVPFVVTFLMCVLLQSPIFVNFRERHLYSCIILDGIITD